MIGLLIGTCILFALAGIAGAIYALMAWFIIANDSRRKKIGAAAIGFAIPIVSVAYMWLCVALLPQESIFGDVDQPLPNGYRLRALAKMPEYGRIEKAYAGSPSVESLEVNGPLVAAKVCQSCDPAFVEEAAGTFLILDTRNMKTTYYPTPEALQPTFGRPLRLTENLNFRSQEPAYRRQRAIDKIIMFTPPIVMSITFFVFLAYRRRESFHRRSNL